MNDQSVEKLSARAERYHPVTVQVPGDHMTHRQATTFVMNALANWYNLALHWPGQIEIANSNPIFDATSIPILAAFDNCHRHNDEIYKELCSQRPAGSQWGEWIPGSGSEWAAIHWSEVAYSEMPEGSAIYGCRYFRTTDPRLLKGAVEHVGLSPELDRSRIRGMVLNSHGWSLVTDEELPRKPATEAWLILGSTQYRPTREKPEIPMFPYTAFPGRMAATVPPDWDGDISKLDLATVPYVVKHIPLEERY